MSSSTLSSSGRISSDRKWIERVQNTATRKRIEIATRRLLLASGERLKPDDVLIDAVIVWENLFRSEVDRARPEHRNPETDRDRHSSSVAGLRRAAEAGRCPHRRCHRLGESLQIGSGSSASRTPQPGNGSRSPLVVCCWPPASG